jgi:hypothetical protein
VQLPVDDLVGQAAPAHLVAGGQSLEKIARQLMGVGEVGGRLDREAGERGLGRRERPGMSTQERIARDRIEARRDACLRGTVFKGADAVGAEFDQRARAQLDAAQGHGGRPWD